MIILYAKILHIFGFVAWFAGLFYLVRMFVYHAEAEEKNEPERSILQNQFQLMQQRVYKIIVTPAMNITWIGGLTMIYFYGWEWFKVNDWLHTKLVLLVGLVAYQLFCKRIMNQLAVGQSSLSAWQFRLLNEVPTLFLLGIAMLAVLKSNLDVGIALGILFVFVILLYIGARLYRRVREKQEQ